LEAVRLQIVPGAEGVVDQIIVVGEPQALRFALDHGRCRHIEVAKIAKEGEARVIVANQAGLVQFPQVKAHAHAQRRALELIVQPAVLAVIALVFRRSGTAKDIRATGVGGVQAVVREVAVEGRALFHDDLHFRAFLVAEVHPKARQHPENVGLPPLID
jgi:hypothetical protein